MHSKKHYILFLIFAVTVLLFISCSKNEVVSNKSFETEENKVSSTKQYNNKKDSSTEVKNNSTKSKEESSANNNVDEKDKGSNSTNIDTITEVKSVISKSMEGQDYVFTFEDESEPYKVSEDQFYYIFDYNTNKKHKLLLPFVNSIIAAHENSILYSGKERTYVADLNTLKVKPISNDPYSNSNVPGEEKRIYFFEFKDDWLYYCEVDYYTDIPKLYKLNINTGRRNLFESSDLISAKDAPYTNFILDERGMIPQRGRCPFTSDDDYNIRWNQVLKSSSFGEKGLIDFHSYTTWDNKRLYFDDVEYESYRNSLVLDDDTIIVISYDYDKSITINTYDYSMNLIDTFKSEIKDKIKHFMTYLSGKYILITSVEKEDGVYLGYDIENKVLKYLTKDKYKLLPDTEGRYFIIDRMLFNNAEKLLCEFQDYESIQVVPLSKGPEFLNQEQYGFNENNFRYNFKNNNPYIFLEAYKKDYKGDYKGQDLYAVNNNGDTILLGQNVSYKKFNKEKFIIFETVKEKEIIKTNKINIDVTKSKGSVNDFYIDMTIEEAYDVLKTKDLKYHEESTVPMEIISPKYAEVKRKAISKFNFGDNVLYIYNDNWEYSIKLVFDEKTNKLVYIESTFPTITGFKKGIRIDEMKSLYGGNYELINWIPKDNLPRGREESNSIRYEYKFKNHYFNVVETDGNGLVDYWYISKFGRELNRVDVNEKFWLVIDINFVDLSVPIHFVDLSAPMIPDFLKLLNKDELAILRNAYYAKHGYIFKDEKYREYFLNYYWYMELHDNVDKLLTPTEQKNIQMILEYE